VLLTSGYQRSTEYSVFHFFLVKSGLGLLPAMRTDESGSSVADEWYRRATLPRPTLRQRWPAGASGL
jgi:hypothetical protein